MLNDVLFSCPETDFSWLYCKLTHAVLFYPNQLTHSQFSRKNAIHNGLQSSLIEGVL